MRPQNEVHCTRTIPSQVASTTTKQSGKVQTEQQTEETHQRSASGFAVLLLLLLVAAARADRFPLRTNNSTAWAGLAAHPTRTPLSETMYMKMKQQRRRDKRRRRTTLSERKPHLSPAVPAPEPAVTVRRSGTSAISGISSALSGSGNVCEKRQMRRLRSQQDLVPTRSETRQHGRPNSGSRILTFSVAVKSCPNRAAYLQTGQQPTCRNWNEKIREA
jgi:hypothetical protein